MGVALGHGEADADLEPPLHAQADALQRLRVAALHAPEGVVRGPDAIETHPDVVEPHGGNGVDGARIDQGAVARQAHVHAQALGPACDLEDVRSHERLAARQNQHPHPARMQVVQDAEHLGGVELAGKLLVGGAGIAMLAQQVALPDQVPDHHRPASRATRGTLRRHRLIGQQGLEIGGHAQHGQLQGIGNFRLPSTPQPTGTLLASDQPHSRCPCRQKG